MWSRYLKAHNHWVNKTDINESAATAWTGPWGCYWLRSVNTHHNDQAAICIARPLGKTLSPWLRDHVDQLKRWKKRSNGCTGGRVIDRSPPRGRSSRIVDVSGCCRVIGGWAAPPPASAISFSSPPPVRLPCGNGPAHITSLLFNAAVITPACCNWTEIWEQ